MLSSLKKYSAISLLIIFSCYFTSINFCSHTHVINGHSVGHSHFGGGSEHSHSESQISIIDILSNFQSEDAAAYCGIESPDFLISESCIVYRETSHVCQVQSKLLLRGPPQC